MPSLPEDLIILAVGAKPRGGPNNGKLPWQFCYGMRGAMLVALAFAGRVEVAVDGQIVVLNDDTRHLAGNRHLRRSVLARRRHRP